MTWDDLKARAATIKITQLQGTVHGKLIPQSPLAGTMYYKYQSDPGYMGKDQAVFMAEFEGKHYKVVINFVITEAINENSPQCPEPQLIKVNDKPVSGSTGYDSGYSLGSLSVNIADLLGGAVGQTTGTNITLDTNAANYNWFIDTTPADNSEFLPTSNPYEWVAKEGTAAYGKMDMLSVLLHEYGHALGITGNNRGQTTFSAK